MSNDRLRLEQYPRGQSGPSGGLQGLHLGLKRALRQKKGCNRARKASGRPLPDNEQ